MNRYKNGLIIGKFMPFHLGHKLLIDYGSLYSEKLTVAVCTLEDEPIDGVVRFNWLKNEYKNNSNIEVVHITENLPSSSESSRVISMVRSKYLMTHFPHTDVVFTSEQYGDYLAEYMGIDHKKFDEFRSICPISGSQIRSDPYKYRYYLAYEARDYFLKRVILVGSESTGKSTMTKMLADYYGTTFVPEMARLIVEHTDKVVFEDLLYNINLQNSEILYRQKLANRILFIDTDYHITQSYSNYLFNKELSISDNTKTTHHGDLYLYLNTDCDYIQDGTRINLERRETLDQFHRHTLDKDNITYHIISGNDRNERFIQATTIIDNLFKII